jgi:MarR family transcriptional regulator, temperature-dependent positive regulator of motility
MMLRITGMAGHLIRRLNQLSTHAFLARLQSAGYDLTPVQFAAMDVLTETPGLDQSTIAALIAYDRATIGGVIDRLEQKGYITRTTGKRDKRCREVALTPEGRLVYDRVFPIVTTLQDDILAGLDTAEQTTFLRLTQKAVDGAAG